MAVEMKVTSWFDKTIHWLERLSEGDMSDPLDPIGQMGVDALSDYTPKETGMTAASWDYKITRTNSGVRIDWYNTNEPNGENVALLIQYGHGTGTGGYVPGEDYINPAMGPVFDAALDVIRKEVSSR